jgi:hypothetical protein
MRSNLARARSQIRDLSTPPREADLDAAGEADLDAAGEADLDAAGEAGLAVSPTASRVVQS